ncbi:MAG TPA: GAF domain-containing protein, partial [Opitutaceae bacterium]|nr:GAF domain-containing protein [Opitutaceae bacterium]
MSRTPYPFTLTNCDRDPVHIPESIQPHGFLLAADARSGAITHVSQNYPTTGSVSALLGQPLAETLSLDPQAHALLTEIFQTSELAPRPIILQSTWQPQGSLSTPYQLIAHQRSGFVIVEGESISSHVEVVKEDAEHSRSLKPVLLHMTAASSLDELCELVVAETRRLTGFDRVLIYQFDEDWNGSVVAEDRNDVLPSYLRHRFPASDIPKPARDFYHINRLRMIADAAYTPVPIESIGTELAPLDLTHASLRGVSPVHLEYMRNMGTGCSMSVSLMMGERLWGLLSCHCASPRRVSFEVRNTCDLLGHIFSLQLATREQARHLTRQVELRSILSRLLRGMTSETDFIVGLNEPDLLRLADSHGAVVVRGEDVHSFGRVPNATAL